MASRGGRLGILLRDSTEPPPLEINTSSEGSRAETPTTEQFSRLSTPALHKPQRTPSSIFLRRRNHLLVLLPRRSRALVVARDRLLHSVAVPQPFLDALELSDESQLCRS